MNVFKKMESERRGSIKKILSTLFIMAFTGYFLDTLIAGGLFLGWEIYFVLTFYICIVIVLIIMDAKEFWWIHYRIYVDEDKLKIKHGFLSRPISIPIDRLYYISSEKLDKDMGYDSIFITDKKITHKQVKRLSETNFNNENENINTIKELKSRYPEKTFYYYRIEHKSMKFVYYFYMLYRICDRCRFSDTVMELVKLYANSI